MPAHSRCFGLSCSNSISVLAPRCPCPSGRGARTALALGAEAPGSRGVDAQERRRADAPTHQGADVPGHPALSRPLGRRSDSGRPAPHASPQRTPMQPPRPRRRRRRRWGRRRQLRGRTTRPVLWPCCPHLPAQKESSRSAVPSLCAGFRTWKERYRSAGIDSAQMHCTLQDSSMSP